jgi:hypothetical protein
MSKTAKRLICSGGIVPFTNYLFTAEGNSLLKALPNTRSITLHWKFVPYKKMNVVGKYYLKYFHIC